MTRPRTLSELAEEKSYEWVTCHRCDGFGEDHEEWDEVCRMCDGNGDVLVELCDSDHDDPSALDRGDQ